MRTVAEWIGKNDDQPIPVRVKDRISRRAQDCCQQCKRPIMGKLRGEFDHIVPLILGGENRESNLQLLCKPHHDAKTKLDVKVKSKIASVRAKHLNLRSPRQKIASRGFQRTEPQHTATRPIERRQP